MRRLLRLFIFSSTIVVLNVTPVIAGINYIEYRERYGNDPREDLGRKKKANARPKTDSEGGGLGTDSRPSQDGSSK